MFKEILFTASVTRLLIFDKYMNCTKRYIWWGLDWKQNNTCSQYIRWRNIWLSYNLESQETWTSNTRYYHHFFWCEAGRISTNRTPKLIYEIIKVLKTGTTGVCDVKCMHGSILFILSNLWTGLPVLLHQCYLL